MEGAEGHGELFGEGSPLAEVLRPRERSPGAAFSTVDSVVSPAAEAAGGRFETDDSLSSDGLPGFSRS